MEKTPPTGTIRSWLDRRADEQGTDISHYFIDADPLTWGELRTEAARIASKLSGMGLSKGDSVALMLPNTREGILCLFGVLYAGFRTAIINLVAGAEAMGYALFHSDAVVVLVGEKQVDLLTAASAAQDIHMRVIVVGQSIVWPDNAQSGPLPISRRQVRSS